MTLKRLSTTLRAGAMAALFVVGTNAAAYAAPIVSFSTTGIFGSGSNIITFTDGGVATVQFNGVPLNSHDLQFGLSNTNYGDFVLTTAGDFTGTASTPFTLNIMQSSPTGGESSLLAQLTGSFVTVGSAPGSSATDFRVDFASTSTTINGVTYHIQPFYLLAPPLSGTGGGAAPGVTTIQGFITAQPTVVPEPATMMLLGTGLLAAFRARRRMTNDR